MEFDSILSILKVVLGVGLVIFVHELGHFIAARRCGVRVDVFSLGMGPRLFSWVRGHTRYQVSVFPIGGYVKMAGEERRLDGLPPRPDDLAAKSVGARFFIYSGGVIMNVLFGLVVFPILFAVGVRMPEPVLGEPIPGGGAWHAGLEAGTRVFEVNGREIYEFAHIRNSVALGDPEGSDLLIETPGGERKNVTVVPRYDESIGAYLIGSNPPRRVGPNGGLLLDASEDGPLKAAGVQTGDELLGVPGADPGLSIPDQVGARVSELVFVGDPIELRIADANGVERTVTVEPVEQEPAKLIGVQPPMNRVAGMRGRALRIDGLTEGDRLLELDGTPILRQGDLRRAVLAAFEEAAATDGARTIPFLARRAGEERRGELTLASRADAERLLDDLALGTDFDTTMIIVNPGEAAAAAGLRDRDAVRTIGGVPTSGWEDTRALIQKHVAEDEPVVLELERHADGELVGITAEVSAQERMAYDYRIAAINADYLFRTTGLVASIRAGLDASWRFAEDVVITLRRMMTADVSAKNIGGPITIGVVSHTLAKSGWSKLFFFLCMLSINLAILNILPIPVLDGGHLFFLIVEKIKGSPVSERVLVYSQVVGMVLLISLMIFVTYNDVVRWFLTAA